jgi:putative restriction endonuclease
LQSDGFWKAIDANGGPSPDRRLTRSVKLDLDFVRFAMDPLQREKARHILISTYFEPGERIALYTLAGLPIPSDEEIARAHVAPEEAKQRGREVRFRLNVVAAYKHTCALTGLRIITIDGGSIVDAAHIHQFARSGDNDTRNGIALCKNAHWLFDNGLWTIADDFTVIVAAEHFAGDHPDQLSLQAYQGRRLRLPADAECWPRPIHLAWHRQHKYMGGSVGSP